MTMTRDELATALAQAKRELSETLARTIHLYFGIDFAWVGYLDDDNKLQLLAAVLSLSLDEKVAKIEGSSGRLSFGYRRLAVPSYNIVELLGAVVGGSVEAPDSLARQMHFAPSGSYSNIGNNGDMDEVTVTKISTPNVPSADDWHRLAKDLQAGKASPQGSFLSLADLWQELGIDDPKHNKGVVARIPRRGSLIATRNPDGTAALQVFLPVKAELQEAKLQVYQGVRLGQPHSLGAYQAVDAGPDCVVTVPWTVGPSGKDTVQLFFADRLLAKCEITDITPRAHAYLSLDHGAVTLRRFLLPPPLPTSSPKEWTKEERDAASRFEAACGTLLALLGFRVTPLGNLEKQGDWLVEHKVGDAVVQFLVESSVALKDKIDLKKLAADARQLGKQQQFHVPATVFTSVSGGTDLSFAGNAEVQHVRVLHKTDLESLLALALDTTTPNRAREAFTRITGLMI